MTFNRYEVRCKAPQPFNFSLSILPFEFACCPPLSLLSSVLEIQEVLVGPAICLMSAPLCDFLASLMK